MPTFIGLGKVDFGSHRGKSIFSDSNKVFQLMNFNVLNKIQKVACKCFQFGPDPCIRLGEFRKFDKENALCRPHIFNNCIKTEYGKILGITKPKNRILSLYSLNDSVNWIKII